MSLKNKYWIIRIVLLFAYIYLGINFMYYFFSFIREIINPKYINLLIYSLLFFPIIIYIVLILFFWKKADFSYKSKFSYKIFFSLFFLIYISNFIKSSYNYHYSQHFTFSFFTVLNFFLMIFIAPILEEIIFRDIFLIPFIKEKKIIFGIIFTSFLFAIGHFPLFYDIKTFKLINFIDFYIFGILLSIIRVLIGLKYAILAHSFRNLLSLFTNYNIINLLFIEWIPDKNIFNITYYIFIVLLIIPTVWLINSLKKYELE